MSLTEHFDKLKGGTQDILRYETAGIVRNLHLVQPDGSQIFLNYAYLISGEYMPEENQITLIFTTHKIVLTGKNLSALYEGLAAHVPKRITATDKRYAETKDEGDIVVTGMVIQGLER